MTPDNSSFLSHLEELRARLIRALIAVIILSIAAFVKRDAILALLIHHVDVPLVFISPLEAFYVSIKISVLTGIIVSLPYISYQAWAFLGDAFKNNEKRILFKYFPVSVFLFFSGAVFAFFVVFPAGFSFLINIIQGFAEPMISIDRYISLLIVIVLLFGISFQLPLVMRVLTITKIINRSYLASSRPYAIVGAFILAALITPPDVITQISLAIPLVMLYEIGIIISKR